MTLFSRRLFLTGGGAALLAMPGRATPSGPTTLIRWSEPIEGFGGFSGIELSRDRGSMIVVSDIGYAIEATLERNDSGMLVSARATRQYRLTARSGAPLRRGEGDAEGLDWDGSDQIEVSFESGALSRITRYARGGAQISQRIRDPGWRNRPHNATLEALAIDPEGRALVLTEAADAQGFPLYRQTGDGWEILAHLPSEDDFRPVGADFGPDGALYLLERKFRVAFFGTRISRITPDRWQTRDVLVETAYGVLDNHEGLSITEDAQGRLWATTISDDNHNRFQRTEIAEFLLRP